jgi:hypothetical protein
MVKTLAIDLFEGRAFNSVTLALAAAGLIVAIAGVYLAVKSLRGKRRRLSIFALPPAALLTQYSERVSDLRIEFKNKTLNNPQIVAFVLENFGDLAIDSSCFDQNRAIRLELGVPILEVLNVSLGSNERLTFEHSKKKTSILLGPDVLKPRQRLTVSLLVGEPNLKQPVEEHLTGTEVEYVPPGKNAKFEPRSKLSKVMLVSWIAPFVAVIIGAIVSFTGEDAVVKFDPANAAPGQVVTVTGSGFDPGNPIRLSVMCGYSDPFMGGNAIEFPITEVPATSKGEIEAKVSIPEIPKLKDCRLNAWQSNGSRWHYKNASQNLE